MTPASKLRASRKPATGAGSAVHHRHAHSDEFAALHSSDALASPPRLPESSKKLLRVMKFGGTSVGDASCIRKVIAIILSAVQQSEIVVVVSAMSGVTNKLLEAALLAESGDAPSVAAIFSALRALHFNTAAELLASPEAQAQLNASMENILSSGERLCAETLQRRELTLRAQDAISSVGERLSALLVSAALAEFGLASQSVDAVDIIVTDSIHGAAEPRMELTRQRSQTRLFSLLNQGIIPVVTGFIGATPDGVLTTLGRGGSDYSATILAAALAAQEVIIWTDVNGVLTADPRLVSGVSTIPELSYREAAELAHFGAKVLHPKTIRPLIQSGIPVLIRNTFGPDLPGTRVTPSVPSHPGGIKAVSALRDVARITLNGPLLLGLESLPVRARSALAAAHAEVLMTSNSSSQSDICFVVPLAVGKPSVDALLSEFSQELAGQGSAHVLIDSSVALIAVVGENSGDPSKVVGRIHRALQSEEVEILAVASYSAECTISFLVHSIHAKSALAALHGEFSLGSLDSQTSKPEAAGAKRKNASRRVSPSFTKDQRNYSFS